MGVTTAAVLAFLLGLEGLNSPLFAQAPPVTAALDQYLAGQHEAAVMSLAALDDAHKVRRTFMADAAVWIVRIKPTRPAGAWRPRVWR
jgi:hypothetical protein